jgi:glycine cleavage system aminomethyltransferase T
MWSYVEGRPLAMGYLNRTEGVTKQWVAEASFDIEVAGERIPAAAQLGSFHPARARTHM